MEIFLSILYLCILVVYGEAQVTNEGPCFDFNGDSYLQFNPSNFDNNNYVHYTMKFRTSQDNGVLLYARGQHGDDEALYLQNGKLRYHLFNTSPHGIEGHFGASFEGDETVNTDSWITVHLFRLWGYYDRKLRRMITKTGFEVEIDGRTYSHVDNYERHDISIQPDIYFGGYREPLSSSLSNFDGQIKDIYEEKNNHKFQNPSLNYGSRVGLTCHVPISPNISR